MDNITRFIMNTLKGNISELQYINDNDSIVQLNTQVLN